MIPASAPLRVSRAWSMSARAQMAQATPNDRTAVGTANVTAARIGTVQVKGATWTANMSPPVPSKNSRNALWLARRQPASHAGTNSEGPRGGVEASIGKWATEPPETLFEHERGPT